MIATDTLETKIAKAKENLSEETRDAINAVSWKLILSGINKEYSSDQLESLEIETELLLCGLVSTEDYPKELESRMHLHKAEVEILINEIDKLIFKKIQEGLEKRLNEVKKVEVVQESKPFINDPNLADIPKDVQAAVALSNWKEKLYTISKKYNLSVDKMGELEAITIKALSGEIPTSKYESEVGLKINLPEDKRKEMVKEINEEIFRFIKGTLVDNSSVKLAENKDIPLPPYLAKKEDIVPLPPPSYKKEEVKIEVKKDEQIIKNEDDLYKEHGIEIISDIPLSKETVLDKKENYREEIPVEIKKMEEEIMLSPNIIPRSEKVEYREEIPNIQEGNIIANKLFKNTVSKTTINDYSLPKISKPTDPFIEALGNKALNPHDPYHESI